MADVTEVPGPNDVLGLGAHNQADLAKLVDRERMLRAASDGTLERVEWPVQARAREAEANATGEARRRRPFGWWIATDASAPALTEDQR